MSAPHPLDVLVVDANFDEAESCAILLGMLGHEVRIAGSCREAHASVERFAPDIIVFDIGLPDGDGYALAGSLAARLKQRPVFVAVTGCGNHEDRSRNEGIDHHLLDPVEPEQLARVLEGVRPCGAVM